MENKADVQFSWICDLDEYLEAPESEISCEIDRNFDRIFQTVEGDGQ
jgi:hypothetical protein